MRTYLADTHRTRPSEYEVFLHRKGVEEIFSVLSTYEDASRETKDYDTVKELLKFIHVLPDIYGVEKGTILIMRVEDSASTILFCFHPVHPEVTMLCLKVMRFYLRTPEGVKLLFAALERYNQEYGWSYRLQLFIEAIRNSCNVIMLFIILDFL
jgi:hypothetical protein